jgi:sugar phosphate isomerase/epimerase
MLRLGIVTYNIAKDWDLPTILSRLEKLGYEGVELRTSHKHGVESTLSDAQRAEVRKRFDDSPVELAGLGTAFEFQSPDPAEVRKNIDGAMDYVRLAHDLGCRGIKVRPNGVPKGQANEPTFRRIGQALTILGEKANGFGVEIRVEVHGGVTQEWPNFAQIMRFADHPNVFTCWNSNPTDVTKDGSIATNFQQVAGRIREVHLRDLTDTKYPWRELFALLEKSGYDGFTLAEIPESSDPERVLGYFKALWLAYQPGE